jgi:hypothetical protein
MYHVNLTTPKAFGAALPLSYPGVYLLRKASQLSVTDQPRQLSELPYH